MNDLLVAALVASAAFFLHSGAVPASVLACLTVALLVGTKVTGLLALPILLVIALLAHSVRVALGKEIVYLNYAAVDPALTNDKCNYWHFRLDADTSMKMEALTTFMKDQPKVKKVYLINQNYSHGQQVAKYFKEGLARKRPDVQIVGDDLHPLGQVKDFAPYVAKIKQSGADTIVTGNWGQDMTLLIKALNDCRPEGPDVRLLRRRHGHADGAGRGRRPARSTRSPTTIRTTPARFGS